MERHPFGGSIVNDKTLILGEGLDDNRRDVWSVSLKKNILELSL